jgi:hypothetical protein
VRNNLIAQNGIFYIERQPEAAAAGLAVAVTGAGFAAAADAAGLVVAACM